MKSFVAKVVDKNGNQTKIIEKAISKEMFEDSVYSKGYFVVEVKEFDKKQSIFIKRSLSKNFLLDFSYNVYTLLDFGIDINEAVLILKNIYIKGEEANFTNDLANHLKKGEKLYISIKEARGGELFNDFLLSMIAAGEISGKLKDSFNLIYKYLKNSQKIKDKIISAILYPIILIVASFFSVNSLFLVVLPNFQKMYKSLDFIPPLLIQIMFALSNFIVENFIFYLFFIIFSIIGFFLLIRIEKSRKMIYHFLIKLPIISKIFYWTRKINISFNFLILSKGGFTLEDSFKKMIEIEKNKDMIDLLEDSLTILKNGGKITEAFTKLKIFDPKDLNIIQIAESISRSQDAFEKIYVDTETTFENYLEKLFKLIEPIMMIVIAFFIFLIMYLVISPTLSLIDKF
ncbi:MAG: hypothetical protein A2086_15585 [Spirochaetes bacterium GWD1_27_9]|nr:MAG: hypothetical protein A2Z98_14255 [Spirochaetes bacterium GWB1_27_13]OHD22497.1 MAG: hypothetical protein A2Y34_06760 [Spirochaetes bacterium GWC1_27_15]OHD42803.1 MAG: hypothetical protein A2086_15585 [Spirochaetes bacterium GWD1_27_9]